MPTAWRESEYPAGTNESTGDTEIETSVVVVTVRVVVMDLPEWVAVIWVVPPPTPWTKPWLPDAFEIVATAASDEDQVTSWVMSCVPASEKTPVAWNVKPVPAGTDG